MPAYNRSQYIAEAIESVLNTTFTDFELIITDDCSTDDTFNIAESFAQKDSRIRLYRNNVNLGQFANRNKAASLATGRYLKYLDSDDRLNDGGLEAIMHIMLRHPEVHLGSKGEGSGNEVLDPRSAYLAHFFGGKGYLIQGPSATIFTKQLFDAVGGFPVDKGILADTILMLKMATKSSLVTLPDNIIFWRVHEGQVTVGQRDEYKMLLERDYILRLALGLPDCPLTTEEKERIIVNAQKRFLVKLPERIFKIRSWSKIRHLLEVKEITLSSVAKLLTHL